MFVRMICKYQNEKEKNEIYQVLGALCAREKIQIEDQGDQVVIYVCPQGKIYITEEEGTLRMYANTRHAGAGFHAFVVEFCKALQEEMNVDYELIDDLEYANDGDFHRLHHIYEEEITYIKDVLLKTPDVRQMNYLYDETFFLPIDKTGSIATPLGYLSIRDFATMPDHDLMDFFYVWNNWDKDARYYKNAALLTLAKEGVGPYTNMNETTIKHAHEICDYMELANSMDGRMTLPVAIYNELSEQLGREKMLKDPRPMQEDVCQYRKDTVYHIFDDVRVAAHGACQRSIDPVHHTLCLMAPYQQEDEWHWMLMASKENTICERWNKLQHTDFVDIEDKKVRQIHWQDEDFHIVEAVIEQDEKTLYLHAIVADEMDVPYMQACIQDSGFMKQM